MYKVIEAFADMQDYNHIYHVGDVYPREGFLVSDERLKELSSKKNRLRTPVIELVAEEKIEEKVEKEVEVKKSKKKSEAKDK